jgi:hypothetical protein
MIEVGIPGCLCLSCHADCGTRVHLMRYQSAPDAVPECTVTVVDAGGKQQLKEARPRFRPGNCLLGRESDTRRGMLRCARLPASRGLT